MRDPLPAPPFSLVRTISPIANFLSLRTLPLHIHEVIGSFSFYLLTNLYLAPYLSALCFPRTYQALSEKTKRNWDARVVSFLQSTFISGAAIAVLILDKDRRLWDWRQRIWAYSGATGLLQSFSAGYFLWDLGVSVLEVKHYGKSAVAHAASALSMSLLGFRPFVNYYGLNFLLFELSTPFLNIHWWLDKLGKTGSRLQWINGVLLITTFGCTRLAWGSYSSYHLFRDMWKAFVTPSAQKLPTWLALSYACGVAVLNVLNVFWFSRMVRTVGARFNPQDIPEDKEN